MQNQVEQRRAKLLLCLCMAFAWHLLGLCLALARPLLSLCTAFTKVSFSNFDKSLDDDGKGTNKGFLLRFSQKSDDDDGKGTNKGFLLRF